MTCAALALAFTFYPVAWVSGYAGNSITALEMAVFATCLLGCAVMLSSRA